MAIMHPELTPDDISNIKSSAEAKLYKLFRDTLSDDFEVFFSVGWILKYNDDSAKDGEADFVITHPEYGFLAIEVKGGGISYDANTDKWYSVNKYGKTNPIKDPVKQALTAKYSILSKLKEHPSFQRLSNKRILCGHAIFFPDVAKSKLITKPDIPIDIIGSYSDLNSLEDWVISIFQYWKGQNTNHNSIGKAGIDLFKSIFARSFEVKPLLASELKSSEEKRIKLTNEQARILDLLMSQRRVVISGGAGTGKSLLALEKAKRLADQGFKTLLTCYNRPLAEYLSSAAGNCENLDVLSFHQVCYQYVEKANKLTGRDLLAEAKRTYPNKDLWKVLYPNALAYALEVCDDLYDAIICDEGQDFEDEFWLPLEMLLEDFDSSPFYIFFDENQNLYSQTSSFPIKSSPFHLTINCRNTDKIHEIAYKYYNGIDVMPPDIKGRLVNIVSEEKIEKQAMKIQSIITDLVINQNIDASEIVVLVADAWNKKDYYDLLQKLSLPRPIVWSLENSNTADHILVDTVNRFKGLESQIVLLWGLDNVVDNETLYVGLSRAKNNLYLVGSALAIKDVTK